MKNIITVIKTWYNNLPKEKPLETDIRLVWEDLDRWREELKNKEEQKKLLTNQGMSDIIKEKAEN